MFIATENPRGAKILIDDMHRRLENNGRLTSDLLIFQYLNIIVGSTEEEARRKDKEASDYFKDEANLVFYSSILGADLSQIDLDTPLGDFKTERLQGSLKGLVEAAPNKVLTFRDTLTLMAKNRLVGTPDQISDAFEAYRDVGVTGINVAHTIGIEEAYVFIDQVVPILKERGLMQKEFTPGTLREKLFANTNTPSGPRLNNRHPADRYRLQSRSHTRESGAIHDV